MEDTFDKKYDNPESKFKEYINFCNKRLNNRSKTNLTFSYYLSGNHRAETSFDEVEPNDSDESISIISIKNRKDN